MRDRIVIALLSALCALLCLVAEPAQAYPYHRGYFRPPVWGVWRGGGWRHTWYGGRFGWWWVAGGVWYFYPQPVYPYPDPYAPPTYVAATPSGPAPPATWYYCPTSKTYYPYVTTCTADWQAVPATSAPPTAQPPG